MKYLFIMFTLLVTDNGCSNSKINQEAITLEYTTQGKSAYKSITIQKKRVSKINKHGAKPVNNVLSEKDWTKLMAILKTFDVKNIPHLKAPSQDRFFDGAAIGKLKIKYHNNTYESQSFDHGNPPKEIAALVKEILSISKNKE